MTDIYSAAKRSQVMSAVRPVDTRPEIRVRKELHRRGFRYRLHAYRLPGRPDIVFAAAERARRMSSVFTNNDWAEESFSPHQSAMGRLIYDDYSPTAE